MASVVGVTLWPLLYANWLGYYPNEAHARLMVQGFVGAFALGFLGTAFPKMIGSPSLTWVELGVLLLSYVGCLLAHSLGMTAAGDSCFLLVWVSALGCFAVRLAFFRRELPPPGFILAGMGLAAGIVGTVILLLGRIIILSGFQQALAHLLLNEAFILGPIVGVGGFLFPRFFAARNGSEEGIPPPWARRARMAFFVGLALLGTYLAQAAGLRVMAPIMRALVVGSYLLTQIPIFRRGSSTGSLSSMLRFSIVCLLTGIFVSGISSAPQIQVGVKHILFIGGYGLLLLAVGSRVTWGHSGNIAFAEGKRLAIRIILGIVLLAMATRVVADLIPSTRVSHHIYAALLWIVAVMIWSWGVLRYVRIADPEDES